MSAVKINDYQVILRPSPKGESEPAMIVCVGDDNVTAVRVLFTDDRLKRADPEMVSEPMGKDSERTVFKVNYPTSLLDTMVDLLRNESPVFFQHYMKDPKDWCFTTGPEPVGEGEWR